MKKLLIANWKMNKTIPEVVDFFYTFKNSYSKKREAWVAPQAIHVQKCSELGFSKDIKTGAQNCSEHLEGAYTGELSPKAFKEIGGDFVIIGHSERRQYFNESSSDCNRKIKTALRESLVAVYCVGETLKQREDKETLSIISDQLSRGLEDLSQATPFNLIIAYEPVWAIGTGKTASPKEAQEVHAFIREKMKSLFPEFGEKCRILYGGSVKPDNVEELLAQKDIDGGLVGGASLKAKDFLALCGD
jgi:triosephosphate isomerase (TIM)